MEVLKPSGRAAVTILTILLLAAPSFAKDYDWAVRVSRPANGWLDSPRGSKATIEAEPCCAPANGGTQPDPEEAPILKQLDGRVSRNDGILRLALDGGRTLKITDCPDFSKCDAQTRVHRLIGWWPAQRYYLVEVGFEGGPPGVFLISERDGSSTLVNTWPNLSPSGRYAVAVLSTPVVDDYFQVIDLGTDPPKVVDFEKPPCAGFDPRSFLRPNLVWVDDTHVRFDGRPSWNGADLVHKQLLRIGPGRPQWEC